jgi:hypothetical protein
MTSYHIKVNEQMEIGRSIIAFLQSIPQVVTFEAPQQEEKPKSELYAGLNSAFAEVKLMMDGKKKEKSLDEFLEELRKERENELQNSND